MNSVLVYSLSFFACIVLGFTVQRFRDSLRISSFAFNFGASIIIAFPVIAIMSVRYGIGTDYFNYERVFDYYQKYAISRMELGFSFLMDFVLLWFNEFQFFVLVTSVLTVLLPFYVLFSKSKEYLWLQLLVLLCLYFGLWCNVIRQAVAVGFIVFALQFLLENQRKKFVVFVILASLFHISALGFFPLILYTLTGNKSKNNQKWVIAFAALVSIIFGFFFLNYGASFDFLYSGYISSHREGGRLWIYFLLALFFYVPEIFCLKEICRINKVNLILYIMLVFELLFFLLSFKVAHAYRMGFYFSLAHIYLLPLTLQTCVDKNGRIVLTLYYTLFLGFYFFVTTYLFGLNGISLYATFYTSP